MQSKLNKGVIAALLGGFFVWRVIANLPDPCLYERKQSLKSPNNDLEVYAEQMNCGATVRFVTYIVIEELGSDKKENVFSFYGIPNEVSFYWEDNSTLHINHAKCDDIFGKKDSWESLQVVYDTKCPAQ